MYGALPHTESLSVRLRLEGPRRTDDEAAPKGEDTPLQGEGKATMFSCFINLVNTVVGAGMLGLPGALGGTGYLTGCLLMALGAAFSAHGLVLLTKAAQEAGLPSSFYSVARAAVPEYTVLIDLAVAVKCFGVATGYLITVGDCMVDALDHLLLNGDFRHDNQVWISVVLSRQFWIVGALASVLPISFFRTLDALKTASALAMLFVVFLAVGIVGYAHGWLGDPCLDLHGNANMLGLEHNEDDDDGVCVGDVEAVTTISRTIAKLPIFIFSFTCHQNIFPVVNELRQRSQSRLNLVVALAIGFALALFVTVALEGYSTFGSKVMGDVLLNYPETPVVTVLRICIAVMVALSYPLQLDPSRRCITSLINVALQWRDRGRLVRVFHRRQSAGLTQDDMDNNDDEDTEKDDDNELSRLRQSSSLSHTTDSAGTAKEFMSDDTFYVITFTFLFLSFAVAMVVDDLGVVLAMVGATGSTLVSYILPGLIYAKIHPYMDWSKRLAILQLAVGCLIMPVAMYFVLSGSLKH